MCLTMYVCVPVCVRVYTTVGTLYKGHSEHLSNEGTVYSPNHIKLSTNLPLNWDTSLYRTVSWVPVVSTIERFHRMCNCVCMYSVCRCVL